MEGPLAVYFARAYIKQQGHKDKEYKTLNQKL
jgi:hypothetical protein